MKIRPIQFVSELPSALAFYEALGLSAEVRSRTGNWIELKASAGELGLHDGPEPLEKVAARLRLAGFPPEEDVVDREWGRSLLVRGPDGEIVQIDEQDPELYV